MFWRRFIQRRPLAPNAPGSGCTGFNLVRSKTVTIYITYFRVKLVIFSVFVFFFLCAAQLFFFLLQACLLCCFLGETAVEFCAKLTLSVPPDVEYQGLYRIHTAPLCSLNPTLSSLSMISYGLHGFSAGSSAIKWIRASNVPLITLQRETTVWLVQVSLFSPSVLTPAPLALWTALTRVREQVAFKTTLWIFCCLTFSKTTKQRNKSAHERKT